MMGDDSSLTGCTVDGRWTQDPSWVSNCMVVQGSRVLVHDNTVRNCSSYSIIIHGNLGTGAISYGDEISGNNVYGSFAGYIFAEDFVDSLRITDNHVDDTNIPGAQASGPIGLHTIVAGGTANNVVISSNTIRVSGGFAIEVGAFCMTFNCA